MMTMKIKIGLRGAGDVGLMFVLGDGCGATVVGRGEEAVDEADVARSPLLDDFSVAPRDVNGRGDKFSVVLHELTDVRLLVDALRDLNTLCKSKAN